MPGASYVHMGPSVHMENVQRMREEGLGERVIAQGDGWPWITVLAPGRAAFTKMSPQEEGLVREERCRDPRMKKSKVSLWWLRTPSAQGSRSC